MNFFVDYILPCIYCFGASAAIVCVFNIRGFRIVTSALGSSLGWFAYLLTAGIFQNDIPQYFLAATVISLYAEIMARINKAPVTVYLVSGIIGLVPGSSIYKTMTMALTSTADEFLSMLIYTFEIAGVIALGIFAVSSIMRLITMIFMSFKNKKAL